MYGGFRPRGGVEYREQDGQLVQVYPVVQDEEEGPWVSYYASADAPGDDATWSVYSELYPDGYDGEPLDGSQTFVSTHPNEREAQREVERLYRLAHPIVAAIREVADDDLPVLRDEPGRIVKLTGRNSVAWPGSAA